MTLYEQVKNVIESKPEKEALIFENKHYKFKVVGKRIIDAAKKLDSLGIKKHDVVTVLLPNCPESVFIFYGLSAIGAISYNVHPLTPAASIQKLVDKVQSKYVICLGNSASENRSALSSNINVISVNPYLGVNPIKAIAFKMMSKKAPGIVEFSKIKGSQNLEIYKQESEREDAVYLNTGGTTGEMKVVRISNEALNHVSDNSLDLIRDKVTDSKFLAALPFFHVFGLGMGLHVPLSLGAPACLMLKFNTKEAITQIKKGNATIILGVPGLFNALLSKKEFYGPHLKKQVCGYLGGDSAPEGLVERWDSTMEKYGSSSRLYVGYGLTETSTACNVNTMYGRSKKGSIGRPLNGIKNKIIDLETGEECPPNKLGEILIGGPSLMNGYYGDEELTSTTISIDKDGERWLHTKDYGYIDEDGYLFFKQRTRRIVKINGETLCPSDIENVVSPLEFVKECYCYGTKDERKGQIFKLVVSLRKGFENLSNEDAKIKIEDAIHMALPPAYFPETIVFVQRLPHTSIGKIDPIKCEQI